MIYRRSGGIAGVDETLTVYRGGALELRHTDGSVQQGKAAPGLLDQLQQLLVSPAFAELAPRYQSPGADLFSYELTIPGRAQGASVTTMDGAMHPPILDEVLAVLDDLSAQLP